MSNLSKLKTKTWFWFAVIALSVVIAVGSIILMVLFPKIILFIMWTIAIASWIPWAKIMAEKRK